MRPDLTVAIVSANNLDLLLPCLESVYSQTHHIGLEVYVVDNASDDGTAEEVRAAYPGVCVLRNEDRKGFSTNNNMVLHQGAGRYLMLLNDDTLVYDGALDHMVRFLDAHPRVGALGAYLLNPDGSYQPACARFPNPLIEGVLPAVVWSYPRAKRATQAVEVDSVCGAAMVVRCETFEQVGGLDEAFDPIYSEEVDWCYRIKRSGWLIYMLPSARVVHYGGQTMNRVILKKYELLLSHKMCFFRKHAGNRASNVYRVALTSATLFKFLWWATLSVVFPNKPRMRDRKELHLHILRWLGGFRGASVDTVQLV